MSDPVTTKAYKLETRAAMSSLASKFATKKDQVKGAATPAVKDDLIARMNIDRTNEISDGEHTIIDVQPDFRSIFMTLMFYATIWYPQLEQKPHSKLSPATLVAYFAAIIYGHFLASDVYLRGPMSRHAAEFIREPTRRAYLQDILNLPVPDFLVKIISTLMPASDPRRPLVDYVPTLAAFSQKHDFGRYFPITIFLRAHTFAASVKANEDPLSLLVTFLHTRISTGFETYIGQYFAAGIQDGDNAILPDSKFFQSIVGMFNPAVYRSLSQRSIYSRIPQGPIALNNDDFNPYIFLLNANDEHISEMSTLLESISSACSSTFKFSGVLGTQYDTISGLDIIRHGYSIPALPTWQVATTGKPKGTGTVIDETLSERATRLKYLTRPSYTKKKDLKYPDDDSKITKFLYLVKKVNKSTTSPETWPKISDFIKFDPKIHAYPRVRIFDAYDYNPSTFHTPIMCGLIIETFEVSGFTVPQPSILNTLDEENSQILQSAIPLKSIVSGYTFTGNVHIRAVARELNRSDTQAVGVSLYRNDQNVLPIFDLEVGSDVPTELNGFDAIEHVTWFEKAFSKFGFLTKSIDNKTSAETNVPVPDWSIHAWSPYRFISSAKTTDRMDTTYMLLNLRTVYGTNVTLAEVRNFQESIPIA